MSISTKAVFASSLVQDSFQNTPDLTHRKDFQLNLLASSTLVSLKRVTTKLLCFILKLVIYPPINGKNKKLFMAFDFRFFKGVHECLGSNI